MIQKNEITTLFLDIGGVLLSNGWGHKSRKRAADMFDLDSAAMEQRHQLTFDTYELGKLTLNEYLDRTVFYEPRQFSKEEFRQFMFSQSTDVPEMIRLIIDLKKEYHLKIAVVSNEGRELNDYRIKTFRLNDFTDFFISSSFVHFRKPDADIFHVALDIAQVEPYQVLYIEDQPMFINVAQSLGIRGILHVDFETTEGTLERFGLSRKPLLITG